jgi:riboflavin-specific deaminase-like protein
MAMSADGKIATTDRSVTSFGSPVDHDNLYRLRATADAILCGARTAGTPGVTLDSGEARFVRRRVRQGLAPQPLRVIASGRAGLNPAAELFDGSSPPPVVLVTESAPRKAVQTLRDRGAEIAVFGRRELDLGAALQWLHRERGIRRLVGEGGAELNDALFRAGLVDELHLTLCPCLIGGRSAPTVADGAGVTRLSEATRFHLERVRRVGEELFLVFRVLREGTTPATPPKSPEKEPRRARRPRRKADQEAA